MVTITIALWLATIPVSAQSVDLTGAPAGTISQTFSQLSGVRGLPAATAVATDAIDRRILLIDFNHGTVKQIGRQGEGPGEYRYPMRPFVGSEMSTLVMDASLGRILVISPAGQVTATLRKPENARVGEFLELRGTDAQGLLYFETNSFNSASGGFVDTVAIVRLDSKGNNARVIARVSSGGRVRITTPTGPASLARSITPYPKIDAWVALPDGKVAIVHQEPYRVEVVDGTGAQHTGSAISFTPFPISTTDRKAWQDSVSHMRSVAVRRDGGTGPSGPGLTFPDEAFPKMMPAFVAELVRVTPEGHIWVGRSHPGTETAFVYDIFDGTGSHIGTARLRPNSTVVGFGPNSVYVAHQDPATDLIRLERYAVK